MKRKEISHSSFAKSGGFGFVESGRALGQVPGEVVESPSLQTF